MTYIKNVPTTEAELKIFIPEAEQALSDARIIFEKIKAGKKKKDFSEHKNNELFGTIAK